MQAYKGSTCAHYVFTMHHIDTYMYTGKQVSRYAGRLFTNAITSTCYIPYTVDTAG